jgi:hypothetical protein
MRSPISARWFVMTSAGALLCAVVLTSQDAAGQAQKKQAPTFPPALPGAKQIVTDKSEELLKPPATLQKDVAVARTPPTVEFLYYPGQTYAGNPWSNWGDSLMAGGKYYASIGDHHGPRGNAFVYEYDPHTKKLRQLVDVQKLLNLPEGHYTPGKIHGRIDLGSDGWLYFSTYRGSTQVTTDAYHYQGDWIIRTHPGTGKSEVVVCGPVPKHGIPGSVLDPKRLIFYGGTTAGSRGARDPARPGDILFFAYDLRARQLLCSGPKRQKEYVLFAPSTGRAYYVNDQSELMRYDPGQGGPPVKVAGPVALTGASTQETPQGYIYTVGGSSKEESSLWSFNTKTEEVQNLGSVVVGTKASVSSLDVDPTGRYVYYTVGTHGSSPADGTPVVQFDVQTRRKKVLAFLHPYYTDKYGCTPVGSYSSALDARGETLYVTWNVSRGGKVWDCCALTVIHIPESERPTGKEIP